MPRPPRRKGPVGPLPAFKWDESEFDWKGIQPTADDGEELPIAYLRQHLVANGQDIHYESPKAVFARNRLRPPCVLLGGPSDLFSTIPLVWKDRFDNVGVIHASLPIIAEQSDGVGTFQPPQLQGFPTLIVDEETGVRALKNTATYVGYRVYVWLGNVGYPQDFWDINTDAYNTSLLPAELCEPTQLDEAGEPYDECEDSFCIDAGFDGFLEYTHEPIDCDMIEFRSVSDTLATFEEHIQCFNNYRVAAWMTKNIEDVYTQAMCACGTGGDVAPCESYFVFDEGGQPVMIYVGDTTSIEEKKLDKFNEVWEQFPNCYLPDGEEVGLFDVLTDALIFFEAT